MVDAVRKLSWDDLRIVKAIGEAGTLARTAAAMGANPSTIIRRLARVERLLGIKLFERRRDGYVTTAMGADLVVLAHRMETELVSLTNRIAGLKQDVSGELRITTSDSLAFHLVTPIVTDFLSAYPEVRIQVCVGNAAANLAKGEADVAIRATQKPLQKMVGRKVAVIAWAAYGRRADSIHGAAAASDSHVRRWVSYSDELVLTIWPISKPRNFCVKVSKQEISATKSILYRASPRPSRRGSVWDICPACWATASER